MKFSIIISIILITSNLSYTQWVQTNGPNGISVYQMVQTGSKIYTNTYSGGIYVSTNGGAGWTRTISQLPSSLYILCIAAKGDTVLVGTQDRNNGMLGGIYFSSNGGASWNFVLPMTPYQIASGMLINGSHVIAPGVNYSGNVVYLSTNFGTTWVTIVPANTVGSAMAANGDIIYASGMSVSTDNGLSWSHLPNSPAGVAALIIKNNVIYAGTDNVVYKSTDNGSNWLPTQNGIPTNRSITSFGVMGNNLYVGTYVINYRLGGVYKTSDDGNSWSPIGLNIFYINSLCTSGNNLLAGSTVGLFKTSNDGSNWTSSNSGFPYSNVTVLCSSGSRFLAGLGRLYYTTNHGDYWDASSYTGSDVRSLYSDGSRIVVGGHLSLYISTDNGDTFTYISGNYVGAPSTNAVTVSGNSIIMGNYWSFNYTYGLCVYNGGNYICPVSVNVHGFALDNQSIYAATAGGVYLSTNAGFNWTYINTGLPIDILSIASGNGLLVAGTNGAGPYLSTNNGMNWLPINSGIANSNVFSLIIKNHAIFAGLNGASHKIYVSTNSGGSWQPIDDNLSNDTIITLGADSSYLYASTGTQAGVWRRALTEITGIQPSSNNLPNRFSLYQNYPNPFNPSTKISYDLPSAINIKLVVYDMLGREVKTLVNEKQNAGRHEIEFDASNYPSGVYYYKLSAGNYTNTKKMVLIK